MTKLVALSLAAAAAAVLSTFASTSLADGNGNDDVTVAIRTPGHTTLPTVVVYGRIQRPLVIVDMRQPTAAHEAAAAHEDMKEAWLKASVPKGLQGPDQW